MDIPIKKIFRPATELPPGGPELWEKQSSIISAISSLKANTGDYRKTLADLTAKCSLLLVNSKDVNAAIYLMLGLTRTAGLPGLRTGLGVIRGLLVRYWDHLHPALDATDPRPARGRTSALQCIWLQPGIPDQLQFKPIFLTMPLFGLELQDLTVKRVKAYLVSDPADPARTEFEDTFDRLDEDRRNLLHAVTGKAIEEVKKITAFYSSAKVGHETLNLSGLIAELETLQGVFRRYVKLPPPTPKPVKVEKKPEKSIETERALETPSNPVGPGIPSAFSPPAMDAAITNRKQLKAVLEKMVAYFRDYEPDSPLRLVVSRLEQLLLQGDCLSVLRILSADAAKLVEAVTGDISKPAGDIAATATVEKGDK